MEWERSDRGDREMIYGSGRHWKGIHGVEKVIGVNVGVDHPTAMNLPHPLCTEMMDPCYANYSNCLF